MTSSIGGGVKRESGVINKQQQRNESESESQLAKAAAASGERRNVIERKRNINRSIWQCGHSSGIMTNMPL